MVMASAKLDVASMVSACEAESPVLKVRLAKLVTVEPDRLMLPVDVMVSWAVPEPVRLAPFRVVPVSVNASAEPSSALDMVTVAMFDSVAPERSSPCVVVRASSPPVPVTV